MPATIAPVALRRSLVSAPGRTFEFVLARRVMAARGGTYVWPVNYAPDAPPDFYDSAWTITPDVTLPAALYQCDVCGAVARDWAGRGGMRHVHRDGAGRYSGAGQFVQLAADDGRVAQDRRGEDLEAVVALPVEAL